MILSEIKRKRGKKKKKEHVPLAGSSPTSWGKCGRQAVNVSVSHGCLSLALPPFLSFSLKSNEKIPSGEDF